MLLDAVTSIVAEAAESKRMLHSAQIAAALAERYPQSGITPKEIEDEIIRQVRLTRGAVEMGGGRQEPRKS